MHVVIAGCGRVGSELAKLLAADGHDVVVIDNRKTALDSLGKSFNGEPLLGEAFDVELLVEAGIEIADVFLAVTNSDNANLMAVEVARSVFNVERAIARLYDPARAEAYRRLGVQFITTTKLIANLFYERVPAEGFPHHVTFGGGDVEIVEFSLGTTAAGLSVGELELRNKLRVAAVQRGLETIIPGSRFALAENDLVVAAARDGARKRIEHLIKAES
jgi:trk system potassium uptake protein TrkA